MNIQDISNIVNNLNILYVEDDRDTLDEISETLELFSPNISIATNGNEAYKIFCENKIDLVLTDIEMPQLNGIELIKKIREKDISLPIIILTAHTKNNYLMECVNLNIQAYIQKPINSIKLKESFLKIIEYLHLDKEQNIPLSQTLSYDAQNGTLLENDLQISLNKKEKNLLDLLISNKNKLVTYETIEYEIWGRNDELMTSSALRTVIKNLRKKVGSETIKNISGVGYRLVLN